MSSNREYGNYSKLEKEDPEDVFRRRAQFLIYKVMQRADDSRRPTTSFLRMKLCKLTIKIGKRLKKLRRGVVLSVAAARLRVFRLVRIQWKRLVGCRPIAAGGAGGLPAAAASIFPSL